MLHSTMQPSEDMRRSYSPAASEGGVGDMFGFALTFLRRRYGVIALAVALALSLAIVYLRVTPPTYTAVTQVLLDNPKAPYVKDTPLTEPAIDLTQIETQIQIMRSSAIAAAVIKQLNLAEDPDFNGRGLSLASILRDVRERISRSKAPPVAAATGSDEALIGAFLSRLEIRRVGYGNIIEIAYSASGSARAATIANAVASAYINDQLNAKFEANSRATSWLQTRSQQLGDQAQAAERAVDAYKAKHNIVSSGGQPIDELQISDLNTRLVAARAQTSDALARLNRFDAILSADWNSGPTVQTLGAVVSDALNSSIINSLRTQYLELQRRESEWSTQFGPNHLAVADLRARMREIRTSIHDEIVRLAETNRNDYQLAAKRQQAIEAQLNEAVSKSRTTDSAEVALRELEARAKGYRSFYETFQQRYMGAVQLESFPISEARVISPALPPDSKSKPKSKMILALGAFGGVAFGLGLGLLLDLTDGVFRTPAQVEAALQLPCQSLVPLMRRLKARRRAAEKQPAHDAGKRWAASGGAVDSEVIAAPLSRFAEAIRSIKIEIDLSPAGTNNRVIGVTSALPNEGKTTIAASLARMIAHSGKRAILVDCDLRKPALSAAFAPKATFGLLEVAAGGQTLETALWRDPKTDLDILPMVSRAPLYHTSEILSSEATRALFDRLRMDYDYVIVDLPPLAPLVDARATASYIDGFIFVAEWGRTKVDLIKSVLHNAPNVYENVIGVVLNKTDIKAMARYELRGRELYNDSHYSHYRVAALR